MNDVQIIQKVPAVTRKGLLRWDMMVTTLKLAGWYDVPRNCNGFMVTNTGDTQAEVNDQILYPGTIGTNLGDSKTFGGNFGEVYVGKFKLSFTTPVGAAPAVEVVYKVYTNIED